MPKCLVNVLEVNGDTHWKRYSVNEDGKVMIRPIQGQYNETPVYDVEAIHKTPGFLGLFRKSYVIYPRLSNKFLKRKASELSGIDLDFITKVAKGKILSVYSDEQKMSMLDYAILAGIGFLIFSLVIMPNVR